MWEHTGRSNGSMLRFLIPDWYVGIFIIFLLLMTTSTEGVLLPQSLKHNPPK